MRHTFQAFIDNLAESVDTQDLHNAMANIASALDFPCFAYLRIPGRSGEDAGVISTYPDNWTSSYLRFHYERLDPVIRHARKEPEPFEWGPGIGPKGTSDAQQELLERAARFGIRYGFTIPVRDARAQTAALTFAADDRLIPLPEGADECSIPR